MPLFRKTRSDTSDRSARSIGLLPSLSRKRSSHQNDDNVNPNKKVSRKKNVTSSDGKKNKKNKKKVFAHSVDQVFSDISTSRGDKNVASSRQRKSKSNSSSKKKTKIVNTQSSRSVHPNKRVPLSNKVMLKDDRSFGGSDATMNTARYKAAKSYSTPLRPATSVENHIFNLSAITDDILTSATETVFGMAQSCCAMDTSTQCFDMSSYPSELLGSEGN